MSLSATLLPIIRSIFSRWTALQLAVTHSMGGAESEAKYEAFIQAFAEYLTRNNRTNESDIQEYLDEILDEEFNTVLEDGSSYELAQLFVRYIQLILEGKFNGIQEELQMQQACVPAMQMSIRNENEDDSSASDSEEDMIEEEEEEEEVEKPKKSSMEVDEDGWTTVHRRK